jgi:hypothetical protein
MNMQYKSNQYKQENDRMKKIHLHHDNHPLWFQL